MADGVLKWPCIELASLCAIKAKLRVPPEVAAVGSSSLSNEEAYAIRVFFNEVIKTTEIDFQTDTNQPLEPELIDFVGLDGKIEDLEKDSLFLFVGCDMAIEQPVAAFFGQHGRWV